MRSFQRFFQRFDDSVKYSSVNKTTPAGKTFALSVIASVALSVNAPNVMAELNSTPTPVLKNQSSAVPNSQSTDNLANVEATQPTETMQNAESAPAVTQSVNPIQTKAVQDYEFSQSLYSLVLPVEMSQKLVKDSPLTPEVMQYANRAMLLRLTGRPSYEITPAGENFVAQDKKWLKSFDWVPVMQEGVSVAEQLRLNFEATSVDAALQSAQLKVWPAVVRPSMLVMGTFVQNGNLIKLNQSQVDAQALSPLISQSELMGLRIAIPQTIDNWVFPVAPEQSVDKIQEWLVASEKDYLLSYKLSTRNHANNIQAQFELSWRLFTNSGEEIIKGRSFGASQAELIEKMLPMATARLADLTENKLKQKATLYLNLLEVTDADTLIHAREHLNQELPTIEKLQLSELEGALAQFTVNLKGSYQDFLLWIQRNPNFRILNESEALRQIDVVYSMPMEVDATELEAMLQAETNNDAVQAETSARTGETILQDNRQEITP